VSTFRVLVFRDFSPVGGIEVFKGVNWRKISAVKTSNFAVNNFLI